MCVCIMICMTLQLVSYKIDVISYGNAFVCCIVEVASYVIYACDYVYNDNDTSEYE